MTGLLGGGADFWGPKYGLETYGEFYDAANAAIPTVLPFGNFGLTDTAISAAWTDPWGTPGVALQSVFTTQGLTGDQRAGAAQVATIAAGGNANSQVGSMVQLIIPGCFQVAIMAKAGGQDVVNVIGVQNAGGNAADAAAAVQTAWKQSGGPMSRLSSFYVLSQFYAVDLSSDNGTIAQVSDSTAGSVTTTNSLATAGACVLVKWNGGTRSKSSRGRLYFGPIMETDIQADGRSVVVANLSNFNNSFNAFRNSLAASGYPLVVLSRKLQQAFPVTSSAVETIIATQRRRIRT